jgi:hypothetical protein
MRRITALLASSVLLVAACGGDDDDSAGSVQNDAADELIQQADDANLDPDESCIRDKAAGLSDEDAQKIVDTGSSDTPELSPEGMTIMADAMSCVSGQAMLDSIIEGLPEGVDGDCVRDKLKDADFGAIFESGTMPPELEQAVTDCGTG